MNLIIFYKKKSLDDRFAYCCACHKKAERVYLRRGKEWIPFGYYCESCKVNGLNANVYLVTEMAEFSSMMTRKLLEQQIDMPVCTEEKKQLEFKEE